MKDDSNKVYGFDMRDIARGQLVVLLICLGLLIAGPILWGLRLKNRRNDTNPQYVSATGGDLENVRRFSGQGAIQALQDLAFDEDAFSDGRVEAIKALASKNKIEALVPLLSISEPFAVRQAAAAAFEQLGCDDSCLARSGTELHELSLGKPTAETYLAMRRPDIDSSRIISELRHTSEKDYLSLLNSNPCKARQILDQQFGTDPRFISDLKRKLKAC